MLLEKSGLYAILEMSVICLGQVLFRVPGTAPRRVDTAVAGGAVELLYYRNSFTYLEAFFGGQRGESVG